MRVASLYSGIGGLEVGLARSGLDTVVFSENDGDASKVLAERFPGVPNVGDIRGLDRLPDSIDLVAAGFPCQNLSMVGDKSGMQGAKSSIVEELFRLISVTRPPRVLIENVLFMLRLNGGDAMTALVSRMEALGYHWAYRVLDSRWFGTPQRRRRVFFYATLDPFPERVLLSNDGGVTAEPRWDADWTARPLGFYWTEGNTGIGFVPNGIPTLKAGSGVGIASPPAVLLPGGRIVIPSLESAERLQGFEAGWTKIPGFPDKNRWRLIGNAVTTSVATAVAEWIAADDRSREIEGRELLSDKEAWPTSAWGARGKRFAGTAAVRPRESVLTPLDRMDGLVWKPLSTRATAGFLSRIRKSKLHFPDGFVASVDGYLQHGLSAQSSVA